MDELVVKSVPSPQIVVGDAEFLGLGVEGLEALGRDPTRNSDN